MSDTDAFSKEVLYTPLSVIGQDQQERKRGLKEDKNLISLLRSVSHSYCGYENKIRSSIFESKLFDRSLTLIGGGINNDLKAKKRMTHGKSRVRGMVGVSVKSKIGRGECKRYLEKCIDMNKISVLNEAWIKYSFSFLHRYNDPVESAKNISKSEIIGASIYVKSCVSFPNLIGMEGIVIESKANTWKVAQTNYLPKGRVRIIPKEGSEICLCIKVERSNSKENFADCFIKDSLRGKQL